MRLAMTAGHTGDAPAAEGLPTDLSLGATLIANRAHGTNAIHAFAANRCAWANIPPRSIRKGQVQLQRAWKWSARKSDEPGRLRSDRATEIDLSPILQRINGREKASRREIGELGTQDSA